MYVSMYVCTYIGTYARMHTRTHTCMHVCMWGERILSHMVLILLLAFVRSVLSPKNMV